MILVTEDNRLKAKAKNLVKTIKSKRHTIASWNSLVVLELLGIKYRSN